MFYCVWIQYQLNEQFFFVRRSRYRLYEYFFLFVASRYRLYEYFFLFVGVGTDSTNKKFFVRSESVPILRKINFLFADIQKIFFVEMGKSTLREA